MAEVTIVDVLAPKGRIEPSIFQGETDEQVAARLDEYIADGVERAAASTTASDEDRFDAVRWWVYYRSFDSVWQMLSGAPSSSSTEGVSSRSYSAAQIDNFRIMAEDALAKFVVLIPVDALVQPSTYPGSTSVKTVVVWD